MAAAQVTGLQPETLADKPPREVKRWVQAALDAQDYVDNWLDLDDDDGD